jgi:hypothetical protein
VGDGDDARVARIAGRRGLPGGRRRLHHPGSVPDGHYTLEQQHNLAALAVDAVLPKASSAAMTMKA